MEIIQNTRKWISNFVVKLNLCPFAKYPLENDKIRYVVYEGTDLEELLKLCKKETEFLLAAEAEVLETTFLIHPNVLIDFYTYNDFLTIVNQLIFALDLEGVIQIASFHPDYQFAGTTTEDVTNYTNRSPYPMLHLLREDSIAQVLATYKQPELIPIKNMEKMRQLGKEEIVKMVD